jgi:hypothetical protein
MADDRSDDDELDRSESAPLLDAKLSAIAKKLRHQAHSTHLISHFIVSEAEHHHKLREKSSYAKQYCFYFILFIGVGITWIVGNGLLSGHATRGTSSFGGAVAPPVKAIDGLYGSWLMLSTIGYGDIYPVSTGAKVLTSAYMLSAFALISRSVSAVIQHQNVFAEKAKKAITGNYGTSNDLRVVAVAWGWWGAYSPFFFAWFYIEFIALIFVAQENWGRHHEGEWGNGHSRLFAFMTMSTIGWGVGDMYDPIPPVANGTATYTAVVVNGATLCQQATTKGFCVWSNASASCFCTLSSESRLLLLPFSLVGFVITGIVLARITDGSFWRDRVFCCCLRNKVETVQARCKAWALHGNCCSGSIRVSDGCRIVCAPCVPFSVLVVIIPLCIMVPLSGMEECVGAEEDNMGNLWLGFVSGAFVVVQTASTVGFGDACTARVLRTLDPWVSIFLSVAVLSVFGFYLALMKFAIEWEAKLAFRCLCTGGRLNAACHRRCDDRCCGNHMATLDAMPLRIPTLKQPALSGASLHDAARMDFSSKGTGHEKVEDGEEEGTGEGWALDGSGGTLLDESGRFMRRVVTTVSTMHSAVTVDEEGRATGLADVELIESCRQRHEDKNARIQGERESLMTDVDLTELTKSNRKKFVQKSLSSVLALPPSQLDHGNAGDEAIAPRATAAEEEFKRKTQKIQHDLQESGALPVWFFSIFVFLTNLVIFTALIWPTRQCFSPPIQDFPTFLYFLVTTVTSVGFGDIIPEPACFGRIGTILAMTVGTSTVVALLTRILLRLDILTKRVRTSVEKDRFLKSGLYHVTKLASFHQPSALTNHE